MQVSVFFDALPKVSLQHRKPNVTLVLDFVLLNDVENHVVVLVQFLHGSGVDEWLFCIAKKGVFIPKASIDAGFVMNDLFTLPWKL